MIRAATADDAAPPPPGGRGGSAQRLLPTGPGAVQRDFDGAAMPTDVMHDDACRAFARVLGDRSEGFMQRHRPGPGPVTGAEAHRTAGRRRLPLRRAGRCRPALGPPRREDPPGCVDDALPGDNAERRARRVGAGGKDDAVRGTAQ